MISVPRPFILCSPCACSAVFYWAIFEHRQQQKLWYKIYTAPGFFCLASAGNGKHMSGDEDSNLLIFLLHRQVDIRNELQAFEVQNIDLWLCVDALGLRQPNARKKQSFPSIHRNLCGSIAFRLVSARSSCAGFSVSSRITCCVVFGNAKNFIHETYFPWWVNNANCRFSFGSLLRPSRLWSLTGEMLVSRFVTENRINARL